MHAQRGLSATCSPRILRASPPRPRIDICENNNFRQSQLTMEFAGRPAETGATSVHCGAVLRTGQFIRFIPVLVLAPRAGCRCGQSASSGASPLVLTSAGASATRVAFRMGSLVASGWSDPRQNDTQAPDPPPPDESYLQPSKALDVCFKHVSPVL